jgi:hypothetical protein
VKPVTATSRQRGSTALLAMVYLILITTLAVGFYEATTLSSEISNNDVKVARSYTAAESGQNFMRTTLANVNIPKSTKYTQLFDALYTKLGEQLNGTDNMPAAAKDISRSADGNTIYIPGQDQYIALDDIGSGFRVEITKVGTGSEIVTRVFGRYGTSMSKSDRGIELHYVNNPNATSVLSYGVATKGTITLGSNTQVTSSTDPMLASVLTTSTAASPVTLGSHSVISGDVTLAGSGTINYSGSPTIGGQGPSTWASHIHQGTAPPSFPVADTSVFEDYLNAHSPTIISSASPPGTSFTNIRIKAGANPVFAGGTSITGVVLIETPNIVTFTGNGTLSGVIAAASSVGANTALSATNQLVFQGNYTANDPSVLPDNALFHDLKALSGSVIVAPTFSVSYAGTSNTINGSIIASKVSMTGTSGGTIKGVVMSLDSQPLSLTGSSAINIIAPGNLGMPAGIRFNSHYDPVASSYSEITN